MLASLPEAERRAALSGASDTTCRELLFDWRFWARPNQLAPVADWRVWLVLAGRGFGKTRTGAEWVRAQIDSGTCRRIALVAATAADVRDVLVEGDSGLLRICPPWNRPRYESSKRRLTWPNGARAITYSADEPDRLRGPQHDGAWVDELASWKYPEAFDMLLFGLRIGSDPRCVVTTTPKPVRLVRELLNLPTTAVTRGTTYENRSNLAPAFFAEIISKYEGTRLGRQELFAELLDDVPGALWQRRMLDESRLLVPPELQRIVVGIDPAVTSGEGANETGIVVAAKGTDARGYVLEDLSCRLSPDGWARRAVAAYRHWKADRIVAEVNNGGDLVENTIRTVDPNVSYRSVRASRGKTVRAEPIAALYEQKRIHHIGTFPDLEDQMCAFTPDNLAGNSPDRVDALVWAFTELMVESGGGSAYIEYLERQVKKAGRWEQYQQRLREQQERQKAWEQSQGRNSSPRIGA